MAAKRGRYSTDRSIGILARRLRCGTAEDLREWAKFNDKPSLRVVKLFDQFCADCPLAYRREQLALGRCLRNTGRGGRDKERESPAVEGSAA